MTYIEPDNDERDPGLASYAPLAWLILAPFVALLWAWVIQMVLH